MREKLRVSDEYIFEQCDEDEEIIIEYYFTGERYRWTGHDWEYTSTGISAQVFEQAETSTTRKPAYTRSVACTTAMSVAPLENEGHGCSC
jgi:hypothetical protein